jgi:hypothetical protein
VHCDVRADQSSEGGYLPVASGMELLDVLGPLLRVRLVFQLNYLVSSQTQPFPAENRPERLSMIGAI